MDASAEKQKDSSDSDRDVSVEMQKDTKEVAYDRFRLLLQVVREEEVRDRREEDTSNTLPRKAAAGRLQGDDKEEDHEKNCLHWIHGSL